MDLMLHFTELISLTTQTIAYISNWKMAQFKFNEQKPECQYHIFIQTTISA